MAFEMITEILMNKWRYKFNYIWLKSNVTPATKFTISPLKKHEIIGAFIKPELKSISSLYFDKKSLEVTGKPYRYSRKQSHKKSEFTKQHQSVGQDASGKTITFSKKNYGTRQGTTILEYPNKPALHKSERTPHPTQKPEALLKTIIQAYCPPDGIVLDPFAGSGSTLLSAKKLNRKFIGIEKDAKYYNLIKQRLGNKMESKQQ